jgi:hypothetical protein
MAPTRRRRQQQVQWGEASQSKRKSGHRGNHRVVLHGIHHAQSRNQEVQQNRCAKEVRIKTHDIPVEEEIG